MANGVIPQPQNNSGDGYCKMPDGTLIQWGRTQIAANSSAVTISFSQRFTRNTYGFSVCGEYGNTSGAVFALASIEAGSIQVYRSQSQSYAQGFRWMAIGRWK